MEVYVGLDVSLKRTEVCVVDGEGRMLWRGVADTHPEMIAATLERWCERIVRIGLETGSTTPWLARGLMSFGLPMVVMDARRAVDALKARPVIDGPASTKNFSMKGKRRVIRSKASAGPSRSCTPAEWTSTRSIRARVSATRWRLRPLTRGLLGQALRAGQHDAFPVVPGLDPC